MTSPCRCKILRSSRPPKHVPPVLAHAHCGLASGWRWTRYSCKEAPGRRGALPRANEEIGEAKQLQRCGSIARFKHGWFTEVVEVTRTVLDGSDEGISTGRVAGSGLIVNVRMGRAREPAEDVQEDGVVADDE